MKKYVFTLLFLSTVLPAKTKQKVEDPSTFELQMTCNRLESSKNIRDEWELDFKQASEKWVEVKHIENEFDALENCQEKSDAFHQTMVRMEASLVKSATDSDDELVAFSSEGQKCKTKEKAERLRLVNNRMNSRVQEFRATAAEAGEVRKKQILLSESLESVRKLPSEIEPKVESMKERLSNALRTKQALQKVLDEVSKLEKKYSGAKPCDKGKATEWLAEADKTISKIKEMIQHSTELKPTLLSVLKCKPAVDETLLETIQQYPKVLAERVETSRGAYVVDRCLATASFYDEVSKSIDQGEEAEKNKRRMKEKEEDDLRRASSLPTLRRQMEKPSTETASSERGGGR